MQGEHTWPAAQGQGQAPFARPGETVQPDGPPGPSALGPSSQHARPPGLFQRVRGAETRGICLCSPRRPPPGPQGHPGNWHESSSSGGLSIYDPGLLTIWRDSFQC